MTAEEPPIIKQIEAVSSECIIYYTDGTSELCEHTPRGNFEPCNGPGYGPKRGCPKYDYYHREEAIK